MLLSNDRLADIAARSDMATPGPWAWREDQFREKYMQRLSNGNWRARPGKRASDSWVMLLTGPLHWTIPTSFTPEEIEQATDEWDYPHILALRWNQVRGNTLFNAAPFAHDAAFIAATRTDVPDLLADAQASRALLAQALAALTLDEWQRYAGGVRGGGLACPRCAADKIDGHHPFCQKGNAIADLRAALGTDATPPTADTEAQP